MKRSRPKNITKAKKLLFVWTDKKNYLIHYRMLNFFVRHYMLVEKHHEILSSKQNKWLENYINFNTQKRN